MRTTPPVFKLWIFSYSVVSGGTSGRLWLPPRHHRATGLEFLLVRLFLQPFRSRLEDVAEPPVAGRTPHRVRYRSGTRRSGVGARRSSTRVLCSRPPNAHGAGRTAPWAARRNGERRSWGLTKDAARPGCYPWEAARWGKGRGTQSGNWLDGHRPARWKLRCNGKRPACCRRRRTGACETCGAAACVWQLRRSRVGKRPEFVVRSDRKVKVKRSVSAAPQESQSEV